MEKRKWKRAERFASHERSGKRAEGGNKTEARRGYCARRASQSPCGDGFEKLKATLRGLTVELHGRDDIAVKLHGHLYSPMSLIGSTS